jgi:hypothetical protein
MCYYFPSFLNSIPKSLIRAVDLWIVVLNPVFHFIPESLNRVQIRGVWWLVYRLNPKCIKHRHYKGGCVPFYIILLELKLGVLLQDLLNKWDNNP